MRNFKYVLLAAAAIIVSGFAYASYSEAAPLTRETHQGGSRAEHTSRGDNGEGSESESGKGENGKGESGKGGPGRGDAGSKGSETSGGAASGSGSTGGRGSNHSASK